MDRVAENPVPAEQPTKRESPSFHDDSLSFVDVEGTDSFVSFVEKLMVDKKQEKVGRDDIERLYIEKLNELKRKYGVDQLPRSVASWLRINEENQEELKEIIKELNFQEKIKLTVLKNKVRLRWRLNGVKGFDYVLNSQVISGISESYDYLVDVINSLKEQTLIDLLQGCDCSRLGQRLYQLGWNKPLLALFESKENYRNRRVEWKDSFGMIKLLQFLEKLDDSDFRKIIERLKNYIFLWDDLYNPLGLKKVLTGIKLVYQKGASVKDWDMILRAFVLTNYQYDIGKPYNKKELEIRIRLGEYLTAERRSIDRELNEEVFKGVKESGVLEELDELLNHGWRIRLYHCYSDFNEEYKTEIKRIILRAATIQSLLDGDNEYYYIVEFLRSVGVDKFIDSSHLDILEGVWENKAQIKTDIEKILNILNSIGITDHSEQLSIFKEIGKLHKEYGIIFSYSQLLDLIAGVEGVEQRIKDFKEYWLKSKLLSVRDALYLPSDLDPLGSLSLIFGSISKELLLRSLLPLILAGQIKIKGKESIQLSPKLVVNIQQQINEALGNDRLFKTLDDDIKTTIVRGYILWVLRKTDIAELNEFGEIVGKFEMIFSDVFAKFLVEHPEGWDLLFNIKDRADELLECLWDLGTIDLLQFLLPRFKELFKKDELIFWSMWDRLYHLDKLGNGNSTLAIFFRSKKNMFSRYVINKGGELFFAHSFVNDYREFLQKNGWEDKFDTNVFHYLYVNQPEEKILANIGKTSEGIEGYKICLFWPKLVGLLKEGEGKNLMSFLIEHDMIDFAEGIIRNNRQLRVNIKFSSEDFSFFLRWVKIRPKELKVNIAQLWLRGEIELAERQIERYREVEKYVRTMGSVELMMIEDYLLATLPQLELKCPEKILKELDKLFEVAVIPSFLRNLILFRFLYLTPQLSYHQTHYRKVFEEAIRNGAVVSEELKKLSSQEEVFKLIKKDLISVLLNSNDLEYRAFLENVREIKEILMKPPAIWQKDASLTKKINSFLEVVVGVINGFYINNFDKFLVLSDDVKNNLIMVMRHMNFSNEKELIEWFVKEITNGMSDPREVLNEMEKKLKETNRENILLVEQQKSNSLHLLDSSLVKGVSFENLSSILGSGLVSREYIGGEKTSSDSTPFDSDFSLVRPAETFEKTIMDTEAKNYGDVLLVVRIDDEFKEKYELIRSGVRGEDHVGIRTGIPSTEIRALVLKEKVDNVSSPLMVDTMKFVIANNGFYIPIYDIEGKLIFTPEEYRQLKVLGNFTELSKVSEGTPQQLLEWFVSNNLFLHNIFEMSTGVVEGYSLEEHVLMVLTQFNKYFRGRLNFSFINEEEIILLLLLHDIGKPLAVEFYRDTAYQHKVTLDLIKPIMKAMKVPEKKILMISTLVDQNIIGEIVKSEGEESAVEIGVKKLMIISESIEAPINELLDFLLVFYMCDAGAYTRDAGGRRSLDSLFNFDHTKMTMRLSDKAQQAVDKLKEKLKKQGLLSK